LRLLPYLPSAESHFNFLSFVSKKITRSQREIFLESRCNGFTSVRLAGARLASGVERSATKPTILHEMHKQANRYLPGLRRTPQSKFSVNRARRWGLQFPYGSHSPENVASRSEATAWFNVMLDDTLPQEVSEERSRSTL